MAEQATAEQVAVAPRARRSQTGQPSRPPGHHGFRADIEGLRAVAVVLVIANHLTGHPSGGFIGVDVFFVISGFLITGLLVREVEQTGRLSFRGFYTRRVRRILPGALSVLLAVVVAAHLVFRGARVTQTVTDVLWSLCFAANIHFARIGVDYFQLDRAQSLVQHFWSLAVEEQFYLVWPIVLLVVLVFVGRRLRPRRARALLLAVVVLGSGASFGYSMAQTRHAVTAAYFSSPGRAWELGVGAALAVAAGPLRRLGARLGHVRGALWLLGLAGVGYAALVVPETDGFPAPWAALPVGATALLIAAGSAGPVGGWGLPLTNPASRYLGRISYSLYLWHWPVIVVATTLIPHAPKHRYAVAVPAILGLSVAAYHFIESPLRRLGTRRTVPRQRAGARRRPAKLLRPAAAAATCLALAAGMATVVPDDPPRLPPAPGSLPGTNVLAAPAGLRKAIDTAVLATRFPRKLRPALSEQGNARDHWDGCDDPSPHELATCHFGSSDPDARLAVVLGDSMAMSWLPGIESALAGGGWRVIGLTLEACTAADLPVQKIQGGMNDACNAHHDWAVDEAVSLHPQLVVLSSTEDTLDRIPHAPGVDPASMYETAMRDTLDRLGDSGAERIVTLSPPPLGTALSDCDDAGHQPVDCVTPISQKWVRLADADTRAAAAVGTVYQDTRAWFCTNSGLCPGFVGATAVRWDAEHITDVYARSLAAPLRKALLG